MKNIINKNFILGSIFLLVIITVSCNGSLNYDRIDNANNESNFSLGQDNEPIPIVFIDSDEQTKASEVNSNTLKNTGFYASATTGDAGSETAKWTSVHFTRSGTVYLGGKWWPSVDPNYHFYASNIPITFSASGSQVSANTDTDVICAYEPAADYEEPNFLNFVHILARIGTVSFTAPSGYSATVNSVSFAPIVSGTYNIRTQAWSSTSAGSSVSLSVASANDVWCVPSTYSVTVNYTLTLDDYTETFTRSGNVTVVSGSTNNISGTLPTGNASRLNFTVNVTAWGSTDRVVSF